MLSYSIPDKIAEKYELHNYGHALEILTSACTEEWEELLQCLSAFTITKDDLLAPGGNESSIPQKFDQQLYPHGWRELRITGDLIVKLYPRRGKKGHFADNPSDQHVIEGYIDGHNIDFVKNRVAFDLEWNSKDQTFDRDLVAMRTYFDCGLIDVGVIVTRSEELNSVFDELGIKGKYGASTTWMGKLLYRLKSRRNGGCPILAIGIKKGCLEGDLI